MSQQDVLKEIYDNDSCKIDYESTTTDYFKITSSKIETDNGLRRTFGYQYKMLKKMINNKNTYLSNQSHALYGNYCFKKSIKKGRFFYNMILLNNGEVYLYNETTGTTRHIHYNMEINVHKRKRS